MMELMQNFDNARQILLFTHVGFLVNLAIDEAHDEHTGFVINQFGGDTDFKSRTTAGSLVATRYQMYRVITAKAHDIILLAVLHLEIVIGHAADESFDRNVRLPAGQHCDLRF